MKPLHPLLAAAIIVSDADKGGVGKSFLLRVVAYLLSIHGRSWVGFDLDPRNGHLVRFHRGSQVTQYDWTDSSAWNGLYYAISEAAPSDFVLVDLPAQAGAVLSREYPRLQATAAHLQRPVYRLWTMSPEFDSLNLLSQSLHLVSCNQTFAVKNLRTAVEADFDLWHGSQTREALIAGGGAELLMPQLSSGAARALEAQDMPFIQASIATLEPWYSYDVEVFLTEVKSNFAGFLGRLF